MLEVHQPHRHFFTIQSNLWPHHTHGQPNSQDRAVATRQSAGAEIVVLWVIDALRAPIITTKCQKQYIHNIIDILSIETLETGTFSANLKELARVSWVSPFCFFKNKYSAFEDLWCCSVFYFLCLPRMGVQRLKCLHYTRVWGAKFDTLFKVQCF